MEICKAKPQDASQLTELARAAKASWGYPAEWLAEWKPDLRFSAEYLSSNEVFVARIDDSILGVIAVEQSEMAAEISHLWIEPESQGFGLGRVLVEKAKEVARSHSSEVLRVVSDPHAQSFYEHLGAELVGKLDAPVAGTKRTLPILEFGL